VFKFIGLTFHPQCQILDVETPVTSEPKGGNLLSPKESVDSHRANVQLVGNLRKCQDLWDSIRHHGSRLFMVAISDLERRILRR
jgi:hypothetical protein